MTFLNFFGSGDPVPRRVATGRNTLRATLVRRAEQWPWCNLARWLRGSAVDKKLLAPWPLPRKPGWVDHVNSPLTESELQALRRCVKRGTPFGDESWTDRAVRELGLESTLRPQGRPRKDRNLTLLSAA